MTQLAIQLWFMLALTLTAFDKPTQASLALAVAISLIILEALFKRGNDS